MVDPVCHAMSTTYHSSICLLCLILCFTIAQTKGYHHAIAERKTTKQNGNYQRAVLLRMNRTQYGHVYQLSVPVLTLACPL